MKEQLRARFVELYGEARSDLMRMRAAHGDKPVAQGGQTLSFPFGPDEFPEEDIDRVPNYLRRHKTMYREICAAQENGGAAGQGAAERTIETFAQLKAACYNLQQAKDDPFAYQAGNR